MRGPQGFLPWVIYTVLCNLADVFDEISSPAWKRRCKAVTSLTSDVDQFTNEEILELNESAPSLDPPNHSISPLYRSSLSRLTNSTVSKVSQDLEEDAIDVPEVNALNLAHTLTTIPVPRVRRVIKQDWHHLIVMDYIKGPTLADVWPTFSLWRKIGVALTLRGYIRQLRQLKASAYTPPGPISIQGARRCESPIFGRFQSNHGPFMSYEILSKWFNERCRKARDTHGCIVPNDPIWNERFDDSETLVLTHQNLNPRNIILSEDDRLWIVDWAWSGYYPPWFEYVTMLIGDENEETKGVHNDYWDIFIPFICGPYFKQDSWSWRISSAMYYK